MKRNVVIGIVVFVSFMAQADDTVKCHFVSSSTGLEPVRSAEGKLLSHHRWSGLIERGIFFFQEQQDDWFQGELLADGAGGFYPPYFSYAKCQWNGVPYDDASGQAVYPAFHHSIFINMFLDYYRYAGNEESLQRARALADWNLARSTPETNVYANLPYSTYVQGNAGGFVDGDAVMTDKPAILALAYLRLYRTTLNANYLEGAEKIAETLSANIQSDGHIPFRVIPESGDIVEDYTSSQIYAVELFEALDDMSATSRYTASKMLVLDWLLQNPVSNMVWNGFYEDVGDRPDNRTNWDCIDTARYLISHRAETPQYLVYAQTLHDWMETTFATTNHYYAPAEGFREQLACFDIMGVHMMHWSMLLADLYEVTEDEIYKDRIHGILNFTTYIQPSNNRIAVGPWFGPFWYSCHSGPVRYFIEQFGNFPEWAPTGENHLLASAGEVRDVRYTFDSISYVTDRAGEELLRIAHPLKQVLVNEVALAEELIAYDPATGILRFTTLVAGAVQIEMADISELDLVL